MHMIVISIIIVNVYLILSLQKILIEIQIYFLLLSFFRDIGYLPLAIILREIIYSIAPAAKLRQIAITSSDIPPMIAPTKAPIPVVIPDMITKNITFLFFIPPFFIGTAIDIPSG